MSAKRERITRLYLPGRRAPAVTATKDSIRFFPPPVLFEYLGPRPQKPMGGPTCPWEPAEKRL